MLNDVLVDMCSILADIGNYYIIFIARIESLRGSGRIICMGPYGPKTTKADDKEF